MFSSENSFEFSLSTNEKQGKNLENSLWNIQQVTGAGPVEEIGVNFIFLWNNGIIRSWRNKFLEPGI